MNPGPRKSYELKEGPHRTSFSDYAARVETCYRKLLSCDPSERDIQKFLELHPSLVPGAWTPGSPSGHFPLRCALISQPILPGLTSRQPDFMWIAMHSGTWFPTLIEIERPGKRVFTRAGVPTAKFAQARNQLTQWRTWFNSPVNAQQFIDSYGIPDRVRESRTMQPHMILIYGRRDEFSNNPQASTQRASLLPGHDEELMSFDRLAVDPKLEPAITVRALGYGRYKVKCLPPVFGTGPWIANRLLYIDGFEEALDNTPGISKERKAFLKERIGYWKEWASSPGLKIRSTRMLWE